MKKPGIGWEVDSGSRERCRKLKVQVEEKRREEWIFFEGE
jgi:hypothetical protein